MPTTHTVPAFLRRRTALTTVTVLAVTSLLSMAPTAQALPGLDKDGEKSKSPKPPARMSTVGGSQLGRPGTQMNSQAGAPKLPRSLSARSWLVADAESGDVLAAHNAHWRLAPASTLKMLFADTVLPKFPKERKHTVKPEELQGMGEGSSLVGVKENESYTVQDLWRGVFLRSGNDAVHVLSAMNGGVDKTVREMNERAKELRAKDTQVVSPDGYDEKGQLSSAYDLTLFARAGMQNKDFRDYAATARAKFPGERKKGKKGKKGKRGTFEIQNTNRLLTGDFGLPAYKGLAGVKNGNTTHAGSTFTGVAQRGKRVLLVTVMNPSKDGPNEVYKETAKLLDWGFEASDKVEPVGRLVAPESAQAPGGGKGDSDGKGGDSQRASHEKPGGGVGTALGVTAVTLLILAIVGYAVHRRWPVPELARRRQRGGN